MLGIKLSNMKLNHFFLCVGLCATVNLMAQNNEPDINTWGTNGYVNSVKRSGNTIYLGGNFNYIGPYTPFGALINISTGKPVINTVRPNHVVYVAIPDGSGGWFIGGDFTEVGGVARSKVARINADGTLNAWSPTVNGIAVNQLILSGSTLYIGGDFTSVNGMSRSNLAAIDVNTGNLTSWNPAADLKVSSLALAGGVLYVGGEFTTIGGQSRNRIAALDLVTGIPTSWNPSVTGMVIRVITVHNAIVYIGGIFSAVAGQSRSNIAAVEASTGIVTSWNPGTNGACNTMLVNGTSLYVGGEFTQIGGQPRFYIAALDITTGNATSWQPEANGGVLSMSVSGGTIFVAGVFNQIAGQSRAGLAAINASDGTATSWNPSRGNGFNVVHANAGQVYVGGTFYYLDGEVRNNIAAIDANTGLLTSWNPSANNAVHSIEVKDGLVYIGGYFTQVGGMTRNYLAALDQATGAPTAWNPNPNGQIIDIKKYGDHVYASGNFTNIGGQPRSYIAAIDHQTGLATSWNPNPNNVVNSMVFWGDRLYMGGDFTNIGGQARSKIAAVNISTGAVDGWNPSANGNVYVIRINDDALYAGGDFSSIGGQSRNYLAKLDMNTALAKSWNPGANGVVSDIAFNGTNIYVGGNFTEIGGLSRNRIASLNAATGLATTWNPNSDSYVIKVTIGQGLLFVASNGFFSSTLAHRYFASFSGIPCINPTSGGTIAAAQSGTSPFNPDVFSNTAAPSGHTGNLEYQWQSSVTSASAGFSDISGAQSATYDPGTLTQKTWFRRLARVDCISDWTGAAQSNVVAVSVTVRPNVSNRDAWITNGTVYSMVNDANKLYLGGNFSYVGPNAPYGVGLNSVTGEPDVNFAKPNKIVRAVVPDGAGGWFIGGDFDLVNGQVRNRLARINSDGSLHAWNPNISNGIVNTLAVSGGIVYAGGEFTTVGGQVRVNIVALDTEVGTPSSWAPHTNGPVYAIAISGSSVFLGGDFTSIGYNSRNKLGSVNSTTGAVISWMPTMNGTVRSIAINGSSVCIGGTFTSVGGQPRNRIAGVDITNALVNDWNPNADDTVFTLINNSGTIYVGGAFTSIGGSTRNRIAAIDGTTGIPTSWNPNADGTVSSLTLNGTSLFVGGSFFNIGGQARQRIAEIAVATGSASSWNPNAADQVTSIGVSSGAIYAGGGFLSIGGVNRNGVAALDLVTGRATEWNPNANSIVFSLALGTGTIYLGGVFTMVGGQVRNRIASVNTSTGAVTAWNPDADALVRAISLQGGVLYAGGSFSNIGGQSRNNIAAIDITSGIATSWNPGVDGAIYDIEADGVNLYVVGAFSAIGGQARNRIAAVEHGSGVVTPWNPNANGSVSVVKVFGGKVYIGGSFSTIGGQTRQRIASLDMTTGSPTAWYPLLTVASSFNVTAMCFSGGTAYLGGNFWTVNGTNREFLAAVDIGTGATTSWYPYPNREAYDILAVGRNVWVGGSFSTMFQKPQSYLACFPIPSISWGGSAGGSWSLPENWSPAMLPEDALDLTISTGYPVMDANFSQPGAYTLSINGTGGLVIAPGKTLTIGGTTNFGGKSVTLRSSADGTAAIGRITGSLTGATNVTVERYLPAGRKWRLLGAPLTGSVNTSVYYHWQNNGVPNGSTGVEIWGPGGSLTPNSANTGLAPGASASMRTYDGGWQSVINTNSTHLFNATTNNGFALFQTGPFNSGSPDYIGGSGHLPAAVPTTLSATGSLITGTHIKNFNATSAGQYFLVANPYAAPVNPASFTISSTLRSNLDNVLYMWDAKPNTGNGVGRYVSFNIDGGIYSQIGAGTGFADHTVQIQSGQAFFVRASGAGPATLTFREASKGTSSSHAMLGNSVKPARSNLRMQLEQEGVSLDGAVALFHAGASRGLDAFDGMKMLNTTDNLSLRRAGRSLVFEYHPELTAMDTLFLHLGQMRQATYTLRLEGEGLTIPEGMNARLLDRFTGASVLFDISKSSVFDFKVTADSASIGDRFMIVFGGSGASGQTPETVGPCAVGLRVHPNPVSGIMPLTVAIDPSRGPWDLRLTDISGRVVWQQSGLQPISGRTQIRMSAFGPGVYHLLATDASGQRSITRIVRQ